MRPDSEPEKRAMSEMQKAQIRAAVRQDSPYEMKYAARPRQKESSEHPLSELKKDVPETTGEKQQHSSITEQTSRQLEMTEVFCEENGYQTNFIEEAKKSNIRIIGQLFDTYWLTEAEDKLFIIDQHAAHEKVLFERNMKTFANRDYTSQQLSPPIILSLTMQEQNALKNNLEELTKLGFEIDEFGGNEYAIVAVPDNLYHLDAKQLFFELLDDMVTEFGSGRATTEMIWNKVASASCKAAIKGNQRISRAEMEELIRELLTLDNPYHCPHGRPTMISMSKYEIEKKFKRIV